MASETDPSASATETAKQYRDKAVSAVKNSADDTLAAAGDYRDAAADKAQSLRDTVSSKTDDLKANASAIADDLKGRANQHVTEAKSIVSSVADEARNKISDIVDQQKTAGAEKLSSLSQAAHHAADDLNEQNPQVAKLVRDAASSVDRFAGDLRSQSLGDVVASVSNFARKQPVAFFAGSVLAGFVLARFLKSEPAITDEYYDRSDRG